MQNCRDNQSKKMDDFYFMMDVLFLTLQGTFNKAEFKKAGRLP
jgi:hypothetical protein